MDKRIELLLIFLGTIMALVSCGVIQNEEKDMLAETTTVKEETKEIETTQSDDKKEYLSGIVPEELEYIPEEYKQPAEHPGTLEKLTYTTWESFTYEEHSQELTKEAWVYLPYGYSEEEKGDWAKYIQPITNRLCQEYGLSIIDVDDEKKERQHESYKEWSEYREGNFVWSDMIKRDLDACVLQAKDYEEFLELLSEKGYQIKQGKHLAIKPQGMTRFRRCKSLGDMYCEEAIRDRIVKEDIAFYKSKQDIPKVSIVKCRVKRYRRAGLSGLQKKHYAKLYRVGKLKKRPYSQVWKYREDIRKMHKLQEQYLFLARHNIHSAEELVGTIASLTDKKKETSAEKSRIYKARERSMELFTAADEMENLKPAEQSYRLGDIFFEDEHRKWVALEQELQAQGYSLEEVQALRRHYKEEYSEVCAREKVVCRELNTGKAILNSMIPDSISDGRKTEYNREIIRDRKEQPVR